MGSYNPPKVQADSVFQAFWEDIKWLKGHHPPNMNWRALLAEALDVREDSLKAKIEDENNAFFKSIEALIRVTNLSGSTVTLQYIQDKCTDHADEQGQYERKKKNGELPPP